MKKRRQRLSNKKAKHYKVNLRRKRRKIQRREELIKVQKSMSRE